MLSAISPTPLLRRGQPGIRGHDQPTANSSVSEQQLMFDTLRHVQVATPDARNRISARLASCLLADTPRQWVLPSSGA